MVKEKMFRRGNGRTKVSRSEMIRLIAGFIAEDIANEYEITIGTDSQTGFDSKIVDVVAIHRIGHGGIFFYHTDHIKRFRTLTEKIYEETRRSLEDAQDFTDDLGLTLLEKNIDIDTLKVRFQIHCDIGHDGKTQSLIKEITAWVRSVGYDVAIKPDSYAASAIANKFSK